MIVASLREAIEPTPRHNPTLRFAHAGLLKTDLSEVYPLHTPLASERPSYKKG